MEILDVVAKWGGSVTDASVSILLSTGFSFSTLNSSRVFSMAFTSSAFAVIFVFVVFNSDSSLHCSLLCLRFHFESHFLICFFCTGCSFHFAGCNHYFHSFFLKNGSPHGDKFSSRDVSLPFLLCLTSIYVESVLVTRAMIGSFLSFSDGVW